VLGDGCVTGVKLQRQRLADFDNSARRKPQSYGDSYVLPLDYLIPAIGQTPDLSWMTDCKLETTRAQTFVVNDGLATSHAVVFAAGDAVTGPATIVQAIAQGNQVAYAMDHWFKTGKMEKPELPPSRHDIESAHKLEDFAEAKRPPNPKLPLAERERNFREVEVGYCEKTAQDEAKRCLRCDLEWAATVGKEEREGEKVGT
jgi:NADPH-dependent glutamate synthase beta subunit-like oxidoreductase